MNVFALPSHRLCLLHLIKYCGVINHR